MTRRYTFSDRRIGTDLEAIRQWRILWSMTGLTSDFEEFYRVNGICNVCRGKRFADWESCVECGGTGHAGLVETMMYQKQQLSQLETEGG